MAKKKENEYRYNIVNIKDDELFRKLKIFAINHDMTVIEVAEMIIKNYFESIGK